MGVSLGLSLPFALGGRASRSVMALAPRDNSRELSLEKASTW